MRSGADDTGGAGEQPAAGLPYLGGIFENQPQALTRQIHYGKIRRIRRAFRTLAVQQRTTEVWQLLNKVKQELAGLETALDKTAKKLEEGQNALHTTKRYTARLQKQLEAVQMLDEEDKHDKE